MLESAWYIMNPPPKLLDYEINHIQNIIISEYIRVGSIFSSQALTSKRSYLCWKLFLDDKDSWSCYSISFTFSFFCSN